jgi:hypothetical protein
MEPTARQVHAVARRPTGGVPLAGGAVVHTREVIEVPATPVTVTRHVDLARRCPGCRRTHRPPVDLTGEAVGQRRFGVRLVSLLATLREVGRLPVRVIRELLAVVHGLELSAGGIVGALRAVADRAGPLVAAILARIRASRSSTATRAAGGRAASTATSGPSARRRNGISGGGAGRRRWPTRRWGKTSVARWWPTSTRPTTTIRA